MGTCTIKKVGVEQNPTQEGENLLTIEINTYLEEKEKVKMGTNLTKLKEEL
jgi:hypothetical protein